MLQNSTELRRDQLTRGRGSYSIRPRRPPLYRAASSLAAEEKRKIYIAILSYRGRKNKFFRTSLAN